MYLYTCWISLRSFLRSLFWLGCAVRAGLRLHALQNVAVSWTVTLNGSDVFVCFLLTKVTCCGRYLGTLNCPTLIWLVVWLPSIFISHSLGNLIIPIPIDELIFFRGVVQPPTSYCSLFVRVMNHQHLPQIVRAQDQPAVQHAIVHIRPGYLNKNCSKTFATIMGLDIVVLVAICVRLDQWRVSILYPSHFVESSSKNMYAAVHYPLAEIG